MNENTVPINTPYHRVMCDLRVRRIREFQLCWQRGENVMTVSSSNEEQILRQLRSLAERKIAATMFEGKNIAATTYPTQTGEYKILRIRTDI